MSTRSSKQRGGIEEATLHMESNGVILEAIQGIMVKEIAKVQKE